MPARVIRDSCGAVRHAAGSLRNPYHQPPPFPTSK
jgi:hypothetical protein